MQRIGEDVAEKLDYVPGVFTVERYIRGKWACTQCETITQAPVWRFQDPPWRSGWAPAVRGCNRWSMP